MGMKITMGTERMRTVNIPVRTEASHVKNYTVTGTDEGVDHRGQAEKGAQQECDSELWIHQALVHPWRN